MDAQKPTTGTTPPPPPAVEPAGQAPTGGASAGGNLGGAGDRRRFFRQVLLRGLNQVERSTDAVADRVRQALRDANVDRW